MNSEIHLSFRSSLLLYEFHEKHNRTLFAVDFVKIFYCETLNLHVNLLNRFDNVSDDFSDFKNIWNENDRENQR